MSDGAGTETPTGDGPAGAGSRWSRDARFGAELAVGFARALRAEGVGAPVGSVLSYARALGELGLGSRAGVYWAGRATLMIEADDADLYDRAFEAYWERRSRPLPPPPPGAVSVQIQDDDPDEPDAGPGLPEVPGPSLAVRYSATEILRRKDFATYSAEELMEAQRLMGRMRLSASPRASRRMVASHRRRGHADLRSSMRLAMRTGGEPIRRSWRHQDQRPRRVVILCDVSGSMEPYARALMRFVHATVAGRARGGGQGGVEAFAMGTRLTRLTRALSWKDPDMALARVGAAVPDWSGGTRLGEGIAAFNDDFGVRGMARGAVVVVLSDGWDRGDPDLLGGEMARLHRVAHKVVWVNPLKASPGYAPLARGMAAALPFVDFFVEGHSLGSLEQLVEVIKA